MWFIITWIITMMFCKIHCKKKKKKLHYIFFKYNQLGCLSNFNLNYFKRT